MRHRAGGAEIGDSKQAMTSGEVTLMRPVEGA
jgi:hypothetical protein